jgi:hypothetical protein
MFPSSDTPMLTFFAVILARTFPLGPMVKLFPES